MARNRFIALGFTLGIAAGIWAFNTFKEEPETIELTSPSNNTPAPDNLKDKTVFSAASDAPFSLSAIGNVKHYDQLQEYLQQLPSFDSRQIERVLTELGDGFTGSLYTPALVAAAYQRWSEIDIDSAFEFAMSTSTEDGMYGPPEAQGLAILSALNPDYTRTRIADIGIDNENSHLKYLGSRARSKRVPKFR